MLLPNRILPPAGWDHPESWSLNYSRCIWMDIDELSINDLIIHNVLGAPPPEDTPAKERIASATTLVSVRNTRVLWTALTALMEPRTHWHGITRSPSPRLRVTLRTHLLYFAPAMWWRLCTITMTCVVPSSQGLQLCCSHLHNAWWCICLSPAECQIIPLLNCYLSDAALCPYMINFEMVSLYTIQSSLLIHRLPLHLGWHYRIYQVRNILSNHHTV